MNRVDNCLRVWQPCVCIQNKFFDSGDYNMAKAKTGPAPKLPTAPAGHKLLMPVETAEPPTGSEIPTPETVPQRKSCLQQSKLVTAS